MRRLQPRFTGDDRGYRGRRAQPRSQPAHARAGERVVPDHDGGNDKDTSEASLLKDVTLEHCQYLAVAGADMSLLDVFVWTATSDTGVESLPSHLRSCSDDDCRKLDSGSPGFLAVWSDSPHVVINRDRQILELSLTADDAATKSDALIDLAHAASARLWP